MSFDTDFNYTTMISKLADKITVYEEMAKAAGEVTDEHMQHIYTAKQLAYETLAKNYNEAIAEIKAVQELPQQDKLTLFRFYEYSAASLYRYMRVIAHSYADMLKDEQLLKLIGEKPTKESKVTGAEILSRYTDSTAC